MTSRQYYRKMKKSVERYGMIMDKKKAKDTVKKHLKTKQTIFSALGL